MQPLLEKIVNRLQLNKRLPGLVIVLMLAGLVWGVLSYDAWQAARWQEIYHQNPVGITKAVLILPATFVALT